MSKYKEKQALCITDHHTIDTFGIVEVCLHLLIILEIDGRVSLRSSTHVHRTA